MRILLTLICLSLIWIPAAGAADFYVDPENGSPGGDGSANKPWRTIQEVIDAGLVQSQGWESLPYTAGAKLVPKNGMAPIKAGDTIWLRSGYHGELSITSLYNPDFITIAAEPGQTPQLKRVVVRSSARWRLRGLHVSPSFAPDYERQTMVQLEATNYHGPIHDIVVENCTLSSIADSSGWSANDWDTKAANGISADGDRITLRGNRLTNVNFGISVGATNSLVEYNLIENFSGDGLRGLGDHTVFQYNTVKNCYKVNDNHDDGFQSWSRGSDNKVGTGEVTGIVLRGNRIINYSDPNQPFRCTLQGIGLFDGTFVDWVIENNLIITDHWHGITLLGARNSRVVNNTVLDPNDQKPGPPWIRIAAHKNGTAASGCIVRNNLATSFNSDQEGVTEDHNLKIDDPTTLFVDPEAYDLHLLPNSPAIDKGILTLAPTTDIDGTIRPTGQGIDLGAYEWTENPPNPGPGLTGDVTGSTDVVDPGTPDTSSPADTGGTITPGTTSSSNCEVNTTAPASSPWLLLLGFLALVALRQRPLKRQK